jgi:hypothetical protein
MSLREWIGSQNWATATGGRRFRDNNGVVHFIGISAQPVGSGSSSLERAQGIAELFAKKEVATAIFSDVVSKKKAEQMMQTRSGGTEKDQSAAAATFAKTLQQSIQDRQINGLQELYGDELVHPISQQKIYVSIFGVSSDSAKQALFIEEESYVARLFDVKQQQQLKGRSDGHSESVNRAKQDTREYNAARATAASNVTQRAKTNGDSQFAQRNTRGPNNIDMERRSPETQGSGRGRSQSGSHTGAGGDSFSW